MAKDIVYDAGFIGAEKVADNGLAKRLTLSASAWFKRRKEGEIERIVRENGGVMSDNLEREISRRLDGSLVF